MSVLSKKYTQSINDQTDPALEDLVSEAQALFKVLDSISKKIRNLEKKLDENKAYFPFKYSVFKEKILKPLSTDASNVHEQQAESYVYLGYNSYVEWYLSWDEDENSKRFRLCLVSQRQEFTVVDIEGYPTESSSPLINEIVSKKPLIETDLSTRLKFAEYLQIFIKRFQEHLQCYRTSIERQHLDSFDDEVPFY